MAGIIFSKGSAENNDVFGKSQYPIKAFLEDNVKAYSDMSTIEKIFKMTTSNKFAEKFTSMTGMTQGFLPVGEGGAYPQDGIKEGYSKVLEHETWKDKFVVTKEMIEDSVILDCTTIGAKQFTNQYFLTREKYGSQLLIGAVSGSTTTFKGMSMDCTCNDGLSLFSTSHTSITGNTGVQSNKFAGAFSLEALNKIETKLQNLTDDNGEVLNIAPDTIIIPNDATLKQAVFAAIGSDKDPLTANNGFNYHFGRWTVIVSPYLNGLIGETDVPFFIMDSNYNTDYNGLLFLDRIPLTIKSYIDENTDNNVWSGRARFICGANDWRSICVGGVTGATAL